MPLSPNDPLSVWIHDFLTSDDPRFRYASRPERIRRAIAAYYAARNRIDEQAFLRMLRRGAWRLKMSRRKQREFESRG